MIRSVPVEFMQWLGDHPNLASYVQIGPISANLSLSGNGSRHAELMASLSSALIDELEKQGPVVAVPSKRPKHFSNSAAMDFNKRYFAKLELRKRRKEQMDQLSQTVTDILNLLSMPAIECLSIVIDIPKLYKSIIYDTREILSLMAFIDKQTQIVEEYERPLKDHASQRRFLDELIKVSCGIYDSALYYLQPCGLQGSFEMLMEYEKLPFAKEVEKVVAENDGYLLSEALGNIVYDCLRHFEIDHQTVAYTGVQDDVYYENVLCMMMLRYGFDKLYVSRKSQLEEYNLQEVNKLMNILKKTTFESLDAPPDEYAPPHKKEDFIADVFRSSPQYTNAVFYLDLLGFHTNPFDMLYSIHECIHQIEQAVGSSGSCHDAMLAFEATFSLFLSIVCASDVPNIPLYNEFITRYVPMDGISPYFEFAKAKIEAVSVHLKSKLKETGHDRS